MDYEENFKKGAIKPVFVALAALTVIGVGAAAVLALRTSSTRVNVDEAATTAKNLRLLSEKEQVPEWKRLAGEESEPHLRQEAFAQLAWAHDASAVPLLLKGLESTDDRIRGRAAQALLEYADPPVAGVAEQVKPALLKALEKAGTADRPQVAWALAAFKESAAFEKVLDVYRKGDLQSVQRLDEGRAFDPEVLVQMTSLDKLASMLDDPKEASKPNPESVKQLIATALSRTGDAKWTTVLTKLVQDKSIEVAREAAVGLGRIANEGSVTPLLDALDRADKDSRSRFLEALRDGVGAKGLVLALKSVGKNLNETQKQNRAMVEKGQTDQIFKMLRELEDPRGGDALQGFIQTNPKPHWKTEAALRMAEIGDVRAAATLGWRLKQSTMKLYNKADDPELLRDDMERVVSARMLADLAILYPEKRPDLRRDAEDGAMFWATEFPQPHANVLRFLTHAGSSAVMPKLRTWADPKAPMPKAGETQEGPHQFEWWTAQSALRYLGVTKDASAWSVLEKQLNRRPESIDASNEAMLQGGLAVLGSTYMALGVGAADGFAEWGDSKAFPILTKFIDNLKNNERPREEACFALAWVATDEQMSEVAKKVVEMAKGDQKLQKVRQCYLETLAHRPVPSATQALVEVLKPEVEMELRLKAARALGFAGVSSQTAGVLMEKLKDNALRNYAALALLIGADRETAARAMASYEDAPPEIREALKDDYAKSFGFISEKSYDLGHLARWVDNAEAVSHVKVRGGLQAWVKLALSRSLVEGLETDGGPHSITRVRLRVKLYNDARGSDETKRANAIKILGFVKEKGVLMALRSEPAPVGDLARRAFFEVMNPHATADRVPDAPKPGDKK